MSSPAKTDWTLLSWKWAACLVKSLYPHAGRIRELRIIYESEIRIFLCPLSIEPPETYDTFVRNISTQSVRMCSVKNPGTINLLNLQFRRSWHPFGLNSQDFIWGLLAIIHWLQNNIFLAIILDNNQFPTLLILTAREIYFEDYLYGSTRVECNVARLATTIYHYFHKTSITLYLHTKY